MCASRNCPRCWLLTAMALASAAALAGCASATPLPYRRSMAQAQWQPKGAFAELQMGKARYAGELIAVEPEALVLEAQEQVILVPMPCVKGVTLAMFDNPSGPIAAWGGLGALSTLSHGRFLVFTAPIWLITTPIAAAAQSQTGRLQERWSQPAPEQLARVRKWARFPQGLPSGYVPADLAGSKAGMACGQRYDLPSHWFQ